MNRQFRAGDVLSYVPAGSWHARQGTAIVHDDGFATDTFWGLRRSSGGRVLDEAQIAGAELVFRLGEYRELGEHQRDKWLTYAPEDRQRIGSQGPCRSTYFVRVGAEPSLATMVENAREAVAEAEREVESAERRLRLRRDDLAQLEARLAVFGGENHG